MKLGITVFLTDTGISPVVLGKAVEERGFYSLYLPEHTHLPVAGGAPPALVSGVQPDDYKRSLDPYVALTAAAVVTTNILLGTGVSLIAQHDPIVLAKQIATLDRLCNGRFVLGFGYGWNRAEASGHGVLFELRREQAREHLMCMRALWSEEVAEFHGRFVDLDPTWAWPKPLQLPTIRTLVGGGASPRLFRTIAELADGWMPIGGSGLASGLHALRDAFEEAGRDPLTARVVPFGSLPDSGKLEHFESLGIDEVVLRVPSGDASSVLKCLDELSELVHRA